MAGGVFSGGRNYAPKGLTANNDNGAGSTMSDNNYVFAVTGTTNDANDWVTLPDIDPLPRGHDIIIICAAGSNFELRTPAGSNDKINNVDSDGTQEYLCTDTDTIRVWKANDTWVAQSITLLGAVRTAVIPD